MEVKAIKRKTMAARGCLVKDQSPWVWA